jgi:hypothetical protein
MTLHKWFRATWPADAHILAQRLRSREFSDDNADGFLIDRVRHGHLEARFIERRTFREHEALLDKSLAGCDQLHFLAYSNYPQLELVNGNSDGRAILSRLAEANQFSVTISPIAVDVSDWLAWVESAISKHAQVIEVRSKAVSVGPGVTTKIRVEGGRDWRRRLAGAALGHAVEIERIRAKFRETETIEFEMSSAGWVKLLDCESQALLEVLRNGLRHLTVGSTMAIPSNVAH